MALAPAVYIPGLAYEGIIRMRNRLYSSARLRQKRLQHSVISVGNITMGGTGKTPLVIHIAKILLDLGWNPAILTRGHGRTNPGATHVLQPGQSLPSPALILGDEPALIRRHVPSAWMGVCKSRFHAGSLMSQRDPRMVFVLDDGFQHRSLHRDLDIVVVDCSRPLSADRVFPRGTLREPLSGLGRSQCIILNGSPDSSAAVLLEKEVRNRNAHAQIFHCRQSIHALIPFEAWRSAQQASDGMDFRMESTASPPAYLVGALGNPERFRRDVRQRGVALTGWSFFADHHRLNREDWERCIRQARSSGAERIIITEKDAVKIGDTPGYPLQVAVQSTSVTEADLFEGILRKAVEAFQ